MFIVLLLTCALVPNILPIPITKSRQIINNWVYTAREIGDKHHEKKFKDSLQIYNVKYSSNIASIGVFHGNEVRCILLMEKINSNIYIWDITTIDYQSGTFLVYSLVSSLNNKFTIMYTVEDRWKIAKIFFAS